MGTNLKYTLTNYFATGTITIGGSWAEDSLYPKENCYNQRVSKRCGFDTAKEGNIVLNIGSAQDLDFIALMNHNLTSSATVTLQMNSSDSWGAPPVSEALTYRATDMHIQLSAPVTYQYVRLVVDDSSRANPDIKIGELITGELTELTRNFDWNLRKNKQFNKITNMTTGGNFWTNDLYNRTLFTMTFSSLDSVQAQEIWTMIDAANGSSTPFLMIIEEAPYFVRLPDLIDDERPIEIDWLEALGEDFFPIDHKINSLTITEESRGI